ncbi:MAG: TraR/DksA family transcriptional regulator [Deltaproteobacteria bacterium]|nr:TraR/DksA family transcriptional regulator [Deltaproteobacteria bacterium]
MRHHFHRCPNLRVVTADASDLNGARRKGSIALDELCEAKRLTPCHGLVECDVLTAPQKRTLLVTRATQLREEDGGGSELAGGLRSDESFHRDLRDELLAERSRIVAENQRIETEVASLLSVSRDGNADEADRGDAAAAVHFDDALERLSILRLDAIDRALDAMDSGAFGSCARCGDSIERERLRAMPDAVLCIECARDAEARA